MLFVAAGCDREDTRNAAETAGEKTEQAVNAIGDASRDAALTIGAAAEKVGDKIEDATRDTRAETRPATTVP